MYHTTITGEYLYHTQAHGYGQPVELFGQTTDGDTPVSLLNTALASCVAMCVQSYFKSKQGLDQLDLTLTSNLDYERKHFELSLTLPEDQQLTSQQEAELKAFVHKACRVQTFFSEEVTLSLQLTYTSA